FVRTGRRVAGLAGLAALEPPRIDILAASEQRPEDGDLRRCGRSLIERLTIGGCGRRARVGPQNRHEPAPQPSSTIAYGLFASFSARRRTMADFRSKLACMCIQNCGV